GLRINPKNNGPHLPPRLTAVTLKSTKAPSNAGNQIGAVGHLGIPVWSPDGRRFGMTVTSANGIDLHVVDCQQPAASEGIPLGLNAAYGSPVQWLPDGKSLLVQLVPRQRPAPPVAPETPAGPNIQESNAKKSAVWTYQDLLKTPHDEKLFDYYCTSQLA